MDEFKLDERRIQVEYETNFQRKKYFFKKQDQEPEQFWHTLDGTNIQYQITSECHHRIREIDKQKQDAKERLKCRKDEYFIQAHKDLEENAMKAANKYWNMEDDLKEMDWEATHAHPVFSNFKSIGIRLAGKITEWHF
jgi:hypothetical protein